jgi:chromate transporter
MKRLLEVAVSALRLGLTSFGGPAAHLGYFLNEYVKRRRWLTEERYAELLALSQVLPGPASSKLGIAIGIERAGFWGGLAAWLCFTLPSAVALWACALLFRQWGAETKWFHGLVVVAVPVVAQAVWTMGRKFASRVSTAIIALGAAALAAVIPTAYTQLLVIVAGAVLGWALFCREADAASAIVSPISPSAGTAAWILLAVLLTLSLLAPLAGVPWLDFAAGLYRSGALVFGGGHVVLPLLQQVVVPTWMDNGRFLSGYGLAQAVPGPLFTFASYLGAVSFPEGWGIAGALLGIAAIFLPAFLLVLAALPFWSVVRQARWFRGALTGVNAAVVGLLLAALYNPVGLSAITSVADAVLALVGLGLLTVVKAPAWVVVLVVGTAGAVVAAVGL